MSRLQAQGYADPDRRYWRRRANRTLRRARRTRAILRWAGILAVYTAVLTGLGFVVLRVVDHVTTSPKFALARIDVAGARMASEETILADVESFRGANLFELDLKAIAARVEARPWVLNSSVKRIFPRGIRVTVTERQPVAGARIDGTLHVVDDTGFVIAPAVAVDGSVDLPVLLGPARLEEEELRNVFSRGVEVYLRLQEAHPGWAAKISEIDLSRNDRIVVTTRGAGPKVWLDPVEIERNVNHFLALSSEIEKRLGHAEYVDLRWRDRISLKPAADS